MAYDEERPIIFRPWEVRATLERRKTQFRRVVEPQPPAYINDLHGGQLSKRAPYRLEHYETGVVVGEGFEDDNDVFYRWPFGEPGDRLWVQSDWSVKYQENTNSTWWVGPQGCGLSFTTHGKAEILGPREPAEMPQWVSQELRLPTLELVGRRVEQIKDMRGKDVVAEGFPFSSDLDQFTLAWNESNPEHPFASNPWVWVGEYRVVEE